MLNNVNILNELKDINAAFLIKSDNKNYFFVPKGYFNDFSENMIIHIFIKSLPTSNPYTIPWLYFQNFPGLVLEKIQLNENIKDLKIADTAVYSIPEGYFDNLANDILNKIKNSTAKSVQQELEVLSPFLNQISRTNVYSVPANYFDRFSPLTVLADKNSFPAAKVILLKRKTRKWLNYAAAACIAAVLFGGGYLYFSDNKSSTEISKTYSSVTQSDVQKGISALSDDEINTYLKDNNNIAVYTSTNDAGQQPNMDVQSLLQNVSDEEIQQYLNQDPESSENGGGI